MCVWNVTNGQCVEKATLPYRHTAICVSTGTSFSTFLGSPDLARHRQAHIRRNVFGGPIFFPLNVLLLSLNYKVVSYHLLLWHFSSPKVIIQPIFLFFP